MAYIPEPTRFSNFDEQIVGRRVPILNYKPTWGPSKLNYDITEVNGGTATTAETGSGYEGTIKLSTGTSANGQAEIETKLIGQYQAGNQAEVGWGIILPEAPTGNQFAEWSYSSIGEGSGFGYGQDANSRYIFYINQGQKVYVSQSDWNRNTLSNLDFADGVICQVEFTWYGFGPLEFYIQDRISGTSVVRTLVHVVDITGSVSISDPNQPIRFEVDNGGTADNFSLYVAGHQFSIIAGDRETRRRQVAYDTDIVTLQNTASWQPVVSVQRKSTFRNKQNSVNATVQGFQAICSADASFRIGVAPNRAITNPTYSSHPDWGDESAVEITDINDATLNSSGSFFPAAYRYVQAGGNEQGVALGRNQELLLGNSSEAIIYAKLDAASQGETVKVTIFWEEEW